MSLTNKNSDGAEMLPVLLYMGTPEFSVKPLAALAASGLFGKVYAVTRPDKPQGRGMKDRFSSVKSFCNKNNIEVIQPVNLKHENFDSELDRISPDIIFVAAYGAILPQYVLMRPRYGCINIHASLLPEYRGAAPINRAVIDGKKLTGITIMKMDSGIDTGDIFRKYDTPILESDNYGALHDRLSEIGAKAAVEAAKAVLDNTAVFVPQAGEASYASKISSADQLIDWSEPAYHINDLIRGLSPEPCANTYTGDGRFLRISAAHIKTDPALTVSQGTVFPHAAPGTVIKAVKTLEIVCGDDTVLVIDELQPEGKRRMSARDFINGRGIFAGDILTRALKC